MQRFKTVYIILLTLCLAVLTGQQAQSSEEDTGLLDYLPYWRPLTEGNTWTFKMKHPYSEELLHYTKLIKGTEVVKGVEGVKLEVTDSNVPNGADTEGSYTVWLPDLSEGQTIIKMYNAGDPVFGPYYHLYVPHVIIPRYIKLSDQGKWIQHIASSTCFKEKPGKLINPPIDSCIGIINAQFLGFEDVTVPAGTFKGCLKMRSQMKLNFAQNPVNNILIDNTEWAVAGVGTVKVETEIMFDAEFDFFPFNTIMTGGSELVSASVDGVSYPYD
jgi:hypothetical protein